MNWNTESVQVPGSVQGKYFELLYSEGIYKATLCSRS